MTIHCPHCQGLVEATAEHFGHTVPCPYCSKTFVIQNASKAPLPPAQPPDDSFVGFEVAYDDGSIGRHSNVSTIATELVNGVLRRQNYVRFVRPGSRAGIPQSLQNWTPIGNALVNQNYFSIHKLYDPVGAYRMQFTIWGFLVCMLAGGVVLFVLYGVYLEGVKPGTSSQFLDVLRMKFIVVPVVGIASVVAGRVVGSIFGAMYGRIAMRSIQRPPDDGFAR